MDDNLLAVPTDLGDERAMRIFLWELVDRINSLSSVSSDTISTADGSAALTVYADYTATADDDVILLDGTTNSLTLTLPDIAATRYTVKCVDDTNAVYVAAISTLDGSSDPFRLYRDESIVVTYADGWWIV